MGPSYIEATSLAQLAESEADLLLGIAPSSVVMGIAFEEVILTYDLDQELVEASTDGTLLEVDHRYDSREDFAFVAWSPHWMNQRYNFRYLEDPKDAFGELNNLARGLTLDEDQLNDLGRTVNEAGNPVEDARRWAEDNPEVWQPWSEATERARES